jgi:hypothetical protein
MKLRLVKIGSIYKVQSRFMLFWLFPVWFYETKIVGTNAGGPDVREDLTFDSEYEARLYCDNKLKRSQNPELPLIMPYN